MVVGVLFCFVLLLMVKLVFVSCLTICRGEAKAYIYLPFGTCSCFPLAFSVPY